MLKQLPRKVIWNVRLEIQEVQVRLVVDDPGRASWQRRQLFAY